MNYFFLLILFSIIILAIALGISFLNTKTPTFFEKKLDTKNIETTLTEKTNILMDDGKLNIRGWSKNPAFFNMNYNKINASTSLHPLLNRLRYKKWEFFLICHKDFYLGIGVFDLSYVGGHIFHYYNKSENSEVFTEEKLTILNKPKISDNCWENCEASKYNVQNNFKFEQLKEFNKNGQRLYFEYSHKTLNITIDSKLSCPECESIVTTTPISNDTTLFYHNVKTFGLKSSGKLIINNKKYNLADVNLSYDSGRGVWPIHSGWIWFASNGMSKENELISLNIGHGFSNPESSSHTEDAFFVNGKLFKLPTVVTKELNNDYPATGTYWSFETVEHPVIKNRCDFKMEISKEAKLEKNLILMKSTFKLVYGKVNGRCRDEEGKIYNFENISGFLENKRSVW